MMCQDCGTREAAVHFSRIKNNQRRELFLCQKCADAHRPNSNRTTPWFDSVARSERTSRNTRIRYRYVSSENGTSPVTVEIDYGRIKQGWVQIPRRDEANPEGASVSLESAIGLGTLFLHGQQTAVSALTDAKYGSAPPPRSAEFILSLVVSGEDCEAILGDLEERFRTRILPRYGLRKARFWYRVQVLRCLWPYVKAGLRRLARLEWLFRLLWRAAG